METEEWLLMDKYLDGQLKNSERVAFEARLNTEGELKKELEVQKALRRAIRQQGEQQLRQLFARTEKAIQAEEQIKPVGFIPEKRNKSWLKIAATVSVLLLSAVAGYFLWQQYRGLPQQQPPLATWEVTARAVQTRGEASGNQPENFTIVLYDTSDPRARQLPAQWQYIFQDNRIVIFKPASDGMPEKPVLQKLDNGNGYRLYLGQRVFTIARTGEEPLLLLD